MKFDVTRTWHGVDAEKAVDALTVTIGTPHDAAVAKPAVPWLLPGTRHQGPGSQVWIVRCVRSHHRYRTPRVGRTPGGWGVHLWTWHISVRVPH